MARPVSMSDVARRAGVHQTTVSLALRNDPRLPAATRERIVQLAREMGYRPNPLVSALVSGRKRRGCGPGRGSVLAFLTSHRKQGQWARIGIYRQLFERLKEHAGERGYGLEEFWLHEPGMTPQRLKGILEHRGIRGIVICPLEGVRHEIAFDFSSFAAVALGYTLRSPALDHVSPDYGGNMTLAVTQLLGRGFRRLLFVTTPDMGERVNHLSLGAYLVQAYLHPGRVQPPIVEGDWRGCDLSRRLALLKPDGVIVSTFAERTIFRELFGERYPVAILDCHRPDEDPAGILRSIDEEAQAAISFLTSQVERAHFGLPLQPKSILILGRWAGELSPPRVAASRVGGIFGMAPGQPGSNGPSPF